MPSFDRKLQPKRRQLCALGGWFGGCVGVCVGGSSKRILSAILHPYLDNDEDGGGLTAVEGGAGAGWAAVGLK